ncbi:hypothetical protein [Vibrio cyclitrophicus]|uniref:hypothetical protein n=1 Tax=Vibrio cyclitrophicus TaxID=47951 RepID=UPI000C85F5CA|nr:hypothetical protein [Vibrio cyclitrophicus]PME22298.1 hypothetical protein BCV41_21250 [Vibrio cyclitrophicus]
MKNKCQALLVLCLLFKLSDVAAKEYCYLHNGGIKCIDLGTVEPKVRGGAGGGGCGGSSKCGVNNNELPWMNKYFDTLPSDVPIKKNFEIELKKLNPNLLDVQGQNGGDALR